MTIVTLKDGTSYLIDTDDEFIARDVVEYRLRNRLDSRYAQGMTTLVIDGVSIDKSSKYYNSGNRLDGSDLKCKTGWSYKWSDGKCAEFR